MSRTFKLPTSLPSVNLSPSDRRLLDRRAGPGASSRQAGRILLLRVLRLADRSQAFALVEALQAASHRAERRAA